METTMYLGLLGLDKMETTRMEKKMQHETTRTRDHLGVCKGMEKKMITPRLFWCMWGPFLHPCYQRKGMASSRG